MKKKTLRIVTFILALAMLSGCSKNQEQTEPTSINQAMLIEKSAQEQESYSFPEQFTGDWAAQEGKLTIHADAQVVAEQGVVLPTATVEPREFTQEDVDNLLRVFLKGEPIYSYVQTKQELQDWLDYINSPEWQSDPDKPNSPELDKLMEQRKNYRYVPGQTLLPAAEGADKYPLGVAAPILCQGDLMGCVMLLMDESREPMQEADQRLAQTMAGFLGKQMES